MTYQRVDDLRQRWTTLGVLSALEVQLERIGFSDQYVDDLVALGESPSAPTKSKVIKDGIWGMIEVEQSCLRLLDSPILQHLRGIRQNGFSYLTYPPAEHTRFTHSLGMMSVVSRFLDIISKHSSAGEAPGAGFQPWLPGAHWDHLLRHAALLHDTGHMPFSHVTEAVAEADPELFRCGPISVGEFLFDAEDCLQPEKQPRLADCLSLAIILTPRFARYYGRWVYRDAPAEALLKIGAMVVGLTPEEGMPGLAGLISGPAVDADKIDYINRDAAACGIPVGIDIARLFVRSAFLTVSPAQLQELRHAPVPPRNPEMIFVVNASGLDSIEEIAQARTALYHRVYHHQTTRNAERLFSLILHKAAASDTTTPDLDPKDTFQVWTRDDFGLLAELRSLSQGKAIVWSENLRNRNLPKRACIFGRNFIRLCIPFQTIFESMSPRSRKILSKEITGPSLDSLRTKQLVGDAQRRLEREIVQESKRVAAAIAAGGGQPPPGEPSILAVLPMANIEPERSDCIILENFRLSSTAASSISDEQLEAVDIAKSVGYVMTDVPWREIVFLATRSVLYSRRVPLSETAIRPFSDGPEMQVSILSSLLLDRSAVVERVGLHPEILRQIVNAADRGNYFEGRSRLAPLDVPAEQINSIAMSLRDFRGQGNWHVSFHSVKAFLEQFPIRHRRRVLNLFAQFNILNGSVLVNEIHRLITTFPQPTQRGFVVGLSPDSGNAVRMKLEHELRLPLTEAGWTFKKTIRDVLDEAEEGDTLIFCDDNVTSGSQAVCQFKAWMGVPESEWSQEERREEGIERSPLARNHQRLLGTLQIKIVCARGTEWGRTRLLTELPTLGIRFEGLEFGEEVAGSAIDLSDATGFFADVGRHILAWSRHRAIDLNDLTPEQLVACERDALGYNGARALMCTPMNVPVGTITAFWCPGLYRGEPWMPLLLRRGYLKHLVLA